MSRELILSDGLTVRGEAGVAVRVSLPVDVSEAQRILGAPTAGAIDRLIERACSWPAGAAAFLSAADRRLLTRELRRLASGWG